MSHLKVDGWLANDGGYPGSEPPMLIQIENANLQGKALIQVHIKVSLLINYYLTVIFSKLQFMKRAHGTSIFITNSKQKASLTHTIRLAC